MLNTEKWQRLFTQSARTLWRTRIVAEPVTYSQGPYGCEQGCEQIESEKRTPTPGFRQRAGIRCESREEQRNFLAEAMRVRTSTAPRNPNTLRYRATMPMAGDGPRADGNGVGPVFRHAAAARKAGADENGFSEALLPALLAAVRRFSAVRKRNITDGELKSLADKLKQNHGLPDL